MLVSVPFKNNPPSSSYTINAKSGSYSRHVPQVLTESEAVAILLEQGLEPPDCRAMRAREFGASTTEIPFAVFDKDCNQEVRFDPEGYEIYSAPHPEGHASSYTAESDDYSDRETLYKNPDGRWVMLELPDFEHGFELPQIYRLDDKLAARWLFWKRFDVPPELQCFTEKMTFDLDAAEPLSPGQTSRPVPVWDSDAGVLKFRGVVVRRLKSGADNVRTLFSAFQEDRWPNRMDSPFATSHKLRVTIESANRGLTAIRFKADGTGEGVNWRAISDETDTPESETDDVPF